LIPSLQKFGDRSWTQDKLDRVRKYLIAYSIIMRKRNLHYAYMDVFAGTGYHELKHLDGDSAPLFPEVSEPEMVAFLDGSARIALQVEPRFNKYIFIEKSSKKALELEKLRDEFVDRRDDIVVVNADANAFLQDLCLNKSWRRHRAVLFLDPFGMQVSWQTMEAIARTKAIDTWILFPIGAVNRLLKRNGEIRVGWKRRLDILFGDPDWYDVFFPKESSSGLFGEDVHKRRKSDMKMIEKYFNNRLASIFAAVAPNPYTLRNSNNAPLFLLCFAAANPNAAKTAIKIAQDILGRDSAATPMLPTIE
jgi:three-Cys-motif partner protein